MDYDLHPNRRFRLLSHFFDASSGESIPMRFKYIDSVQDDA